MRVVVASLVALATLAACSDHKGAQPEIVTTVTSPAVTSTTSPPTTIPATTLMPPSFKSRPAAETRDAEWRNIPGSASRECVDVEQFQHLARQVGSDPRNVVLDLRSGEWVAGNFYDMTRASGVAPSGTLAEPIRLKIYWVGLARDPQTPSITAASTDQWGCYDVEL